jgi:glucokinase
VAPGTGLGQALLVFEHGRPIAVPSEGGHADFAPACRQEAALWDYLHRRFGHVSAERVLSGAGQVHIYEWLRESGRWREPAWLAAALARADPARVITDAALARRQPLCVAAVNRFVSILGAVSGNLALTGLATGGLYLGGGIPPRLLPVLRDGPFLEAFAAKGRFRTLLQNIAVRVILNRQAALIGAASTALSIARGK